MQIEVSPARFSDWHALLDLLRSAYAYMAPRIDPPSSLVRMGVAEFQEKARHEDLILARESSRILGCAFAAVREDCVYIGKLAVDESARRRGVARRIIEAAESIARQSGKSYLELETRIELLENHKTFAALGFTKVAENAHPGFDRTTSITMRKPVASEQKVPVAFAAVHPSDLESLVALRIEAMRESLERVGRFDPARARERLVSGFSAEHTRHIVVGGERVGFFALKPEGEELLLDHIYVRPGAQNQGIGSAVLAHVFAEADSRALPVRVGALRESASKRFYVRHGFQLVESGEFDNYYVRSSGTIKHA